MMIWKLAKTLWVGALTSLVLFHANADEIDDALKAGRTAEMTRTEDQKQAARRALENARRRIQDEVAAQDLPPETMKPENLLGEINALEDLKAKLKQELDSLREPEPAPIAVQTKPAPAPVVAGDSDLNAFKGEVNRQISQWREQDLKNQVEQRAALSRQQNELQKSFETMLKELRSDMAKARNADASQVKSLASQYQEQKGALAKQQVEIRKDMESLLAKVDERLRTLKTGPSDPAGLSAEIEKAVHRATAGITRDLEKQFAALQVSVAEVKSAKSGPADTAALEKTLRADFRKDMAVLREGLTKAKVEIKKAQASDPLTQEMTALKNGLADAQAELKDLQGLAAISQGDQAALVKYRKSLKDDILALRSELKDQLQSEIGTLAKSIQEEKTARNAAMAEQAEQMASMEKSLSKQIAATLGASRPAAETEAVITALRKENNILREDWKNFQKALGGRIAQLEKPAPAVSGTAAGLAEELAAFKESMNQSLDQFKATEAETRAMDLKKIEFTLNQYIKDVDQRLASLKIAPVEVAAAPEGQVPSESAAPKAAAEWKTAVDVEPEPEVESGPAPAPVQVSAELTEEPQGQRVRLEALRERLKKSLMEYKAEADAGRQAQKEALKQREQDDQARRKEVLREKIGSHPEAAGKEDRLEEETAPVEAAEEIQQVVTDEDAPAEPVLMKDDSSKKKGLFGWFKRSPKPEAGMEPTQEAASVTPVPAADVKDVQSDEAASEDPAPVAVVKDVETENLAEAPRSEVAKSEPAESAKPIVEKKAEKKGLFGWTRRSSTVEGAQKEDVQTGVDPKATVDVPKEVNGEVAAPLRNGAEGETVRGLRGAIDTQMSAIGGELDQHPIFDLGEVEVAPSQGPKADARAKGGWKYEGGWARGRMNGPGQLTYPDGRVYTGQWDQGIRQGRGELVHPDGWTFAGEWGQGLISGEGSLTYTDGWAYTGSWKKGTMDGAGVLEHPDGWTYTGNWKKGRMSGKGTLSYGDGWTYEGSWRNGKRGGTGTLKHPDGWQYVGNWRNGKRSGKGELTFSDGWAYDGDWKNGTMNGAGTLQHPDGWAYEGEWENGEMAGDGKIIFKN